MPDKTEGPERVPDHLQKVGKGVMKSFSYQSTLVDHLHILALEGGELDHGLVLLLAKLTRELAIKVEELDDVISCEDLPF